MRTQGEYIRTLRRRVEFLKSREYKNSYDAAELGALEWALVNLPPAQRTWVGLTDEETDVLEELYAPPVHPDFASDADHCFGLIKQVEAKLKEKNT
jgi:hypothetical protein